MSADIFTPKCTFSGCHFGGSPAEIQSLEADRIASQITGVASNDKPNEIRIIPGDPDNSYLLKKLRESAASSGPQRDPGRNKASTSRLKNSNSNAVCHRPHYGDLRSIITPPTL